MRTTLNIDDAVLAAARSLARAEGVSLGAAVSTLARRGMGQEGGSVGRVDMEYSPFKVLIGDPAHPVTPELIAEHQDD